MKPLFTTLVLILTGLTATAKPVININATEQSWSPHAIICELTNVQQWLSHGSKKIGRVTLAAYVTPYKEREKLQGLSREEIDGRTFEELSIPLTNIDKLDEALALFDLIYAPGLENLGNNEMPAFRMRMGIRSEAVATVYLSMAQPTVELKLSETNVKCTLTQMSAQ